MPFVICSLELQCPAAKETSTETKESSKDIVDAEQGTGEERSIVDEEAGSTEEDDMGSFLQVGKV